MKTLVWRPSRNDITIQNDDLVRILRQCKAAGIPIESAVIKNRGIVLNFTDDATDEALEAALVIGEGYDRAGEEAAEAAERRARAADILPFKRVQTLLDGNMRDIVDADKATLVQLRGIVLAMLEREAKVLKALARAYENLVVEDIEE